MARRELDFYETAPWQTRALLMNQPIEGLVLEPCVGDRSIANVLESSGTCEVVTNDLDLNRSADFHYDAADPELYEAVRRVYGQYPDHVVSNPPYTMPTCTQIVQNAVHHARLGVHMMLRISFREPTAHLNPRGPFLYANPVSRALTLPRYSFTGNGKSDSATTEWLIWLKDGAPGRELPALLSLWKADETYAVVAK